ncbi:MAG: hypothetical protein Q9181_005581 [Wetmoreana brouardii]
MVGEDEHFPPKPWHGCPSAALARAFHSLGTQSHLFPKEIKQQLRDLKDLYGHHDQLVGAIPITRASTGKAAAPKAIVDEPYPYPSPVLRGGAGHTEEQSTPGQGAGRVDRSHKAALEMNLPEIQSRRKRARGDASCNSSKPESAKRHQTSKHMPWVWGPNATSEEKASFYRGIRSLRKQPNVGIEDEEPAALEPNEVVPISTGELKEPIMKEEYKAVKAVLPSPQASEDGMI